MAPDKAVHAVVFNSIGPALQGQGDWLRLRARNAIADAVLAALAGAGMVVAGVCACGQPLGACPCGDSRCWRCDPPDGDCGHTDGDQHVPQSPPKDGPSWEADRV